MQLNAAGLLLAFKCTALHPSVRSTSGLKTQEDPSMTFNRLLSFYLPGICYESTIASNADRPAQTDSRSTVIGVPDEGERDNKSATGSAIQQLLLGEYYHSYMSHYHA
jgi:hypothetical protein